MLKTLPECACFSLKPTQKHAFFKCWIDYCNALLLLYLLFYCLKHFVLHFLCMKSATQIKPDYGWRSNKNWTHNQYITVLLRIYAINNLILLCLFDNVMQDSEGHSRWLFFMLQYYITAHNLRKPSQICDLIIIKPIHVSFYVVFSMLNLAALKHRVGF